MKTFVGVGIAAALAVVGSAALAASKQGASSAAVTRGEYLVTVGGCNDCHTPMKNGPNGPERDLSRLLSGHPEALAMPPAPPPTGPWLASVAGTFTAWAGPWGVSFTANLTPDPDTGLGKWTVQNFIEAMRTGKHQGRGRPIMPPMPWENYGKMSDADLRAMFTYLQTIPAVRNRVPDPIPPQGASAQAGGGPQSGTASGGGDPGPSGAQGAPGSTGGSGTTDRAPAGASGAGPAERGSSGGGREPGR